MYFFSANAECARGYQILCPAQCGISLCDTEKKSLCRFLPDFFCSRPVKISSHCQSGDISGTWRPKYVSNCNSFCHSKCSFIFYSKLFLSPSKSREETFCSSLSFFSAAHPSSNCFSQHGKSVLGIGNRNGTDLNGKRYCPL